MQVFSGSSHTALAQAIATHLNGTLGKIDVSRFANDESRVRVIEEKVAPKVVLIQSISRPVDENLVEFCLLADALTRKGALEITAVIPWLGYSKQDKVFLPGEPLSAKVVAQILQTTKIKHIFTFDLHNRAITGFFDIPVTELSAKPLFLEYFKKELTARTVVVAPDEGSVKASSYFARELGVPIVYMDKRRDLRTGDVKVVGMTGDVRDSEVIIVDDMIVTGLTAMKTAAYVKSKGALRVSVAATHHLYVPGVQEHLDTSAIDQVIVTDTVASDSSHSKLRILSTAQLITQALA